MVRSGSSPSASATSPNWRSRSTSATRAPCEASATPRLDETTVLPDPPFGPSTQIIREWRSADDDRELRVLLHLGGDERQRPRALAAAGHDQKIAAHLVEGVPGVVEIAHRPGERDARLPLEHQLERVEIDVAVEPHDCRQRAHGPPCTWRSSWIGLIPNRTVSSVTIDTSESRAPACGRSRSQSLPWSAANASSAAFWSGALRTTFAPALPPTGAVRTSTFFISGLITGWPSPPPAAPTLKPPRTSTRSPARSSAVFP